MNIQWYLKRGQFWLEKIVTRLPPRLFACWQFLGLSLLGKLFSGLQLMARFISSAHLALSGTKPSFFFISLLPLRKVFGVEKSCRYNCKGVPFLNPAQHCRDCPCFVCGYKHFVQSSWEFLCGYSGNWRRQLFLPSAPFLRCQLSTWKCFCLWFWLSLCLFLHVCPGGKTTAWLLSVATQLLISQNKQHIMAGERMVHLSEVWK